jgi:hypothetical protein
MSIAAHICNSPAVFSRFFLCFGKDFVNQFPFLYFFPLMLAVALVFLKPIIPPALDEVMVLVHYVLL